MDTNTILLIVNIATVAFAGGVLWQKSADHCRRLDRMERKLDKINGGEYK